MARRKADSGGKSHFVRRWVLESTTQVWTILHLSAADARTINPRRIHRTTGSKGAAVFRVWNRWSIPVRHVRLTSLSRIQVTPTVPRLVTDAGTVCDCHDQGREDERGSQRPRLGQTRLSAVTTDRQRHPLLDTGSRKILVTMSERLFQYSSLRTQVVRFQEQRTRNRR